MLPRILLLALALMAACASAASAQDRFAVVAKQADAARSAGKLADAIDLYANAVRLRPAWSEGWWSLATLLYENDRFEEAANAFRRFAASSPKPGPAYAFLGLCEYETRQYDRALQHFRKWATEGWSGTPELIDVATFHFALLLAREERFIEALYLLAVEVRRHGESPALTEAMGLASLRMKQLPEDYPPELREMVWLAGKVALHASVEPNDFNRANEYAHRLVLHYAAEPGVHYFYGTLLLMQEKKPEAAQEFQAELRRAPSYVPALLELARLQLENDDVAQALISAQRAAEFEPQNPEARHLLGRVLLASNRFAESARELEMAKRLAPDAATIRSHLATAYHRLGREKEAQSELAAFVVLKKKEGVLVPPEEKLRVRKQPEARR